MKSTQQILDARIRMNYARNGLCDARISTIRGFPVRLYPIKLMTIGG